MSTKTSIIEKSISEKEGLSVQGTVQVLGARSLTAKGVTYSVLDVYVEGQGSGTIFLKKGFSSSDVVGLQVGVYNNRLSLVPVYVDKMRTVI